MSQSSKQSPIRTVIAFLLGALFLYSLTHKSDPKNRPSLTAEELALANGIHWWRMEVPPGQENKIFGLQIHTADKVRSGGGSTNWKNSVKIFLWNPKDGCIQYAILGSEQESRGTTTIPVENDDVFTCLFPNGANVKLGDTLIKFGLNGSVHTNLHGKQTFQQDEVGVAFDFVD